MVFKCGLFLNDAYIFTIFNFISGALDVADKLLKRKDKTQMSDSFMKEFMKDEIVLQLDRVDGKLGEYVSCKAGRTTGILRIMPDGSRKKMISIAKVDKNTNT